MPIGARLRHCALFHIMAGLNLWYLCSSVPRFPAVFSCSTCIYNLLLSVFICPTELPGKPNCRILCTLVSCTVLRPSMPAKQNTNTNQSCKIMLHMLKQTKKLRSEKKKKLTVTNPAMIDYLSLYQSDKPQVL